MISVHKADLIFDQKLPAFGLESIPLQSSVGRILAENITCDRDLPPFDRVAMDGIAIQISAYQNGQKNFEIEDIQKAGDAVKKLNNPLNCLEVMTGAIMPLATDTVIKYEDISISNKTATLPENLEIKKWGNVHTKGIDKLKGQLIIPIGQKIGTPEIGILSSVGKSTVKVQKSPLIAIISTGNELVEIDAVVLPHQIRRSNVYAIESSLKINGYSNINLFHLNDEANLISAELPKIIDKHDVIILSGGVSMGKYDLIPKSLLDCGIEEKFHQIKQKPGKPFWYGNTEKKFVYALPGNPVSTLLCLLRYVIPHLKKGSGASLIQKTAYLEKEMVFKKPITFFQPVYAGQNATAKLTVVPVANNGSGDFASLQGTDGFVEFSEYQSVYPVGSILPFYSWL